MTQGPTHAARGSFIVGLDAREIRVEVCVTSGGLPRTRIVGVPDPAVRESGERVRAAIRASGFSYPKTGVLINLAPASVRKTGAAFDLPIALAILAATGQLPPESLAPFLCAGELSLSGELRAVRGVLPMLYLARKLGMRGVLARGDVGPYDGEASSTRLYPARTLGEAVKFLAGQLEIASPRPRPPARDVPRNRDLADVNGQLRAKKAVIAAAAGGHNILLVGPPGCGKTLLARRLPDLLPPPDGREQTEIACIYSVTGLTPPARDRPVRAPHHTVSHAGLIGGGNPPLPGEITLAHRGVLLLDEFSEFSRRSIEALRAPLEDGVVTISRAGANVTFPCRFLLAGTMNPCPCGWLGHPRRPCRCTPRQIDAYRRRISGPILDRIDIQIPLESVTAQEMEAGLSGHPAPNVIAQAGDDDSSGRNHSIDSRTAIEAIRVARRMQTERYRDEPFDLNGEMPVGRLRRHAPLDSTAARPLRRVMERAGFSARSYVRVVRMARTLADLRASPTITAGDVAVAAAFRCLDRVPVGAAS